MNESATAQSISLEALQAGDKSEFARFVEQHSRAIYRLALKMLQNPQDAEDVLQETFIKAYRALPSFEGRSSLSTWLYRIATNEALMFLRRKKPDAYPVDEPVETSEEMQRPIQITDWCCLPEHELMSDEARNYLDQAVAELPQTLQVVFILRDIEGLSTRETAEVLELTETAVKTRLSRARMKLREKLTTYFGSRIGTMSDPAR